MWTFASTPEYTRRHRRYIKDNPRELNAVLANLDTYFATLNVGTKPSQIKHGFIHPETCGVIAIDQRGGKGKLAQTRLYIYPDVDTKTLYLITLGDKRDQKTSDIPTCRQFMKELRKEKETRHERQETQDISGDGA